MAGGGSPRMCGVCGYPSQLVACKARQTPTMSVLSANRKSPSTNSLRQIPPRGGMLVERERGLAG